MRNVSCYDATSADGCKDQANFAVMPRHGAEEAPYGGAAGELFVGGDYWKAPGHYRKWKNNNGASRNPKNEAAR